jgi:hypothetical protein
MVANERSAWGGRLLLFAALLFGIVTMHTLGHPAEEHGSGHGSAGTAASTTVTAPRTAGMTDTTAMAHDMAAPPPGSGTAVSSPDGTSHGMDPMSVCLAVLGAWGVALLGAWLVLCRTAAPDLARLVRGALLRALWPQPPPPRTVLARLSVLRI